MSTYATKLGNICQGHTAAMCRILAEHKPENIQAFYESRVENGQTQERLNGVVKKYKLRRYAVVVEHNPESKEERRARRILTVHKARVEKIIEEDLIKQAKEVKEAVETVATQVEEKVAPKAEVVKPALEVSDKTLKEAVGTLVGDASFVKAFYEAAVVSTKSMRYVVEKPRTTTNADVMDHVLYKDDTELARVTLNPNAKDIQFEKQAALMTKLTDSITTLKTTGTCIDDTEFNGIMSGIRANLKKVTTTCLVAAPTVDAVDDNVQLEIMNAVRVTIVLGMVDGLNQTLVGDNDSEVPTRVAYTLIGAVVDRYYRNTH